MLAAVGELRIAAALDDATLIAAARDASIVIVRAPLPREIFAGAPLMQLAVRHGAGIDMIPVEAATAAGVLVANVPGANAVSVAEHVFFVTLALKRKFRRMDRDLRTKGWNAAREHSYGMSDLAGCTVGVIGMGNVGREIFRIARHGFGLHVIASSRRRESLPEGAEFAGIDELLERADVVVLCCPLTPETANLLNRRRIALMKPGALLVNVSRGAVVDEDALVAALREGRIGGAALDVFVTQPLSADHPFFGFDNVILTPHIAGITQDSMIRMGTGAAAEAIRVLEGRLPLNLRNPDAVSRYFERFPAGRRN